MNVEMISSHFHFIQVTISLIIIIIQKNNNTNNNNTNNKAFVTIDRLARLDYHSYPQTSSTVKC